MSQPPISRQEPRRQRTRQALLAAGLDLVAARPIDAIAIDEIVARAHVAKGSFFNHFKDKDGFFRAISANIRSQVEATVGIVNADIADPAERVARAVCQFARFAHDDPRAARIMLRAHAGGARVDHPLNAGVRSDIASGVSNGRFAIEDADAAVLYVVGLCQVLLVGIVAQSLTAEAARRLASEIVTLLLIGLGLGRQDARDLATRAASALRTSPS